MQRGKIDRPRDGNGLPSPLDSTFGGFAATTLPPARMEKAGVINRHRAFGECSDTRTDAVCGDQLGVSPVTVSVGR